MTPYWTDGHATIWHANALDLPLLDASVDLVVTSPPYFGLRSYQDAGEHYDGQIGSEATPAEFVDALIAATREMVRVLKPSGSLWINLGDKYAGSRMDGSNDNGSHGTLVTQHRAIPPGQAQPRKARTSIPTKSLIGIPWRYALRCIDDLGLILRAEVIWSKPNGLPESVTDRVRRSHEQWFHLVREPRYYSAVDEVREAHSDPIGNARYAGRYAGTGNPDRTDNGAQWVPANPLGKLPGSVWTINEGPSLVRSVLDAVAAGGITPDEGERILTWSMSSGSGLTSNRMPIVGNGREPSTARVMGDTTPSGSGRNEPRESHSSSHTEHRLGTDSRSITSVGTGDASDPNTSKPSPSKSISADDPNPTPARPDTDSTSGTRTSEPTGNGNAADAWLTDPGNTERAGPPSVWVIPTQPLRVPTHLGVDHFAAFPMEWPRRIITGWSPRDVCGACGEGLRPVGDTVAYGKPEDAASWSEQLDVGSHRSRATSPRRSAFVRDVGVTITGYTCACPDTTAPTTPGVVLDPFMGTGTTLLVASALGRTSHGIDLSGDYCRLAKWRITDPGERARALEVDKPPVEIDGQDDLLGLLDFGGIA